MHPLKLIAHAFRRLVLGVRYAYWKIRLGRLGSGTRFYGSVYIGTPHLVSIGKNCTINGGVMFNTRGPITVGNAVRISSRVIINAEGLDYMAPRDSRVHVAAPVVIGDGVLLCAAAIINPGVTIGHDAVVGPGSVVVQDVPPETFVFGVPARVMREIPRTVAEPNSLPIDEELPKQK